MAQHTAISRCAGNNHVHFTISTSQGTINRTYLMSELIAAAPTDDEYIRERIKLQVREAQAAGNTTYAQIRTYLLGLGAFVE